MSKKKSYNHLKDFLNTKVSNIYYIQSKISFKRIRACSESLSTKIVIDILSSIEPPFLLFYFFLYSAHTGEIVSSVVICSAGFNFNKLMCVNYSVYVRNF